MFISNDIKITYLENKPEDISQMTFLEFKGLDSLEHCESILLRIEKMLIKKSKEENKDRITIYVAEEIRPQIQTESQFGRIGKVKIFYRID